MQKLHRHGAFAAFASAPVNGRALRLVFINSIGTTHRRLLRLGLANAERFAPRFRNRRRRSNRSAREFKASFPLARLTPPRGSSRFAKPSLCTSRKHTRPVLALSQLTALCLRQGNCARKARPCQSAYKMCILYHRRQSTRRAPLAHPRRRAAAKTKCAFCIIEALLRLPLLGRLLPRGGSLHCIFFVYFRVFSFPFL